MGAEGTGPAGLESEGKDRQGQRRSREFPDILIFGYSDGTDGTGYTQGVDAEDMRARPVTARCFPPICKLVVGFMLSWGT